MKKLQNVMHLCGEWVHFLFYLFNELYVTSIFWICYFRYMKSVISYNLCLVVGCMQRTLRSKRLMAKLYCYLLRNIWCPQWISNWAQLSKYVAISELWKYPPLPIRMPTNICFMRGFLCDFNKSVSWCGFYDKINLYFFVLSLTCA